MLTIRISPFDNILYESFYLVGFQQLFGSAAVVFDSTPFLSLSMRAKKTSGVLFVLQESNRQAKGYISAGDSFAINEEIYEWCDVYASVNANFQKTPYREKLISLAPSFAIRCWNSPLVIKHAFSEGMKYLKGKSLDKSFKTFLGNYKRLIFRPTIDLMVPGDSQADYVFFCSTLWYNNEWNHNDQGVNLRRAHFIRACKSVLNVRFEGGLVSQPRRSSDELFADCLLKNPYSYDDWLYKTKCSSVVFNTPAFWDCHGWKLGEYLSLGKAIISTPLSNDLPAPLVHGKHIHFVNDDVENMKSAVEMITHNQSYRRRLECGAREWWDTYGTPKMSIKRILSFLNWSFER